MRRRRRSDNSSSHAPRQTRHRRIHRNNPPAYPPPYQRENVTYRSPAPRSGGILESIGSFIGAIGVLGFVLVVGLIYFSGPLAMLASIDPTPAGSSDKTLEIEQIVFEKVNEERARAGVASLVRDPNLDVVARGHSVDMAANNYYSHTDRGGRDPTGRATARGYRPPNPTGYYGLAENIHKVTIGYIQKPDGSRTVILNWPPFIAGEMVDGWMASPGHRANMLSPSYRYIGIGVAFDGKYYLATQDFC